MTQIFEFSSDKFNCWFHNNRLEYDKTVLGCFSSDVELNTPKRIIDNIQNSSCKVIMTVAVATVMTLKMVKFK